MTRVPILVLQKGTIYKSRVSWISEASTWFFPEPFFQEPKPLAIVRQLKPPAYPFVFQ